MTRKEAFELIEQERASQDNAWSDRSQYGRSAPHVLILDEQLRKLHAEWYTSEKDALLERFVKIAAVAIRALEEIEP